MMGPGQRSADADGRRYYNDEGEQNPDVSPPKGIFLLVGIGVSGGFGDVEGI